MQLQLTLFALLDIILALAALGLIRALKPQAEVVVVRDVIRLRGDDVTMDNVSELIHQGYRPVYLGRNLAVMVGESESTRKANRRGVRSSAMFAGARA